MTEPVIYFDGVCNFCNGSVGFVLKRDRQKRFRFATLQSKAGKQILNQFKMPTDSLDSMLLVEGGRLYTQSTAVLRIVKGLGGAWSWLYLFIFIPPSLRDALYRFIARHRYQWFGKRETCMIPSEEQKEQFLD